MWWQSASTGPSRRTAVSVRAGRRPYPPSAQTATLIVHAARRTIIAQNMKRYARINIGRHRLDQLALNVPIASLTIPTYSDRLA